jgi:cytochrome c oxidase subunit 2
MRHSLRIGGLAALLWVAGALPALAQDQNHPGPWLPYAASDYSHKIDFLYLVIFWATTAMFFITEGLLIAFCVMYRRRPGHKAAYTHGNNAAEVTWTIIPALMLIGIAIWQIPAWNEIKKPDWEALKKDPKTTVVDVMGEQYKWNVRYPGSKAKYGGDFDVTGLSTIHMPFGHSALFNLRSKDVIHSVFIPHMRVKQDTVPGLRQRLWFKPNRFFLVDLKAPDSVDWKKSDGTAIKVKPKRWVYLDGAQTDDKEAFFEKDFAQGGRLFDKVVAVSAVSDYAEKDGQYEVYKPNGTPKKVTVLTKGEVKKGQDWTSCDYAVGVFEIACAELCGMGHYTMRGSLVVEPAKSYEAWMKAEAEDAGEPVRAWKFWKD